MCLRSITPCKLIENNMNFYNQFMFMYPADLTRLCLFGHGLPTGCVSLHVMHTRTSVTVVRLEAPYSSRGEGLGLRRYAQYVVSAEAGRDRGELICQQKRICH